MGVKPFSQGEITGHVLRRCRHKKQNSPEGLLDCFDASVTETTEIYLTIAPRERGVLCLGERFDRSGQTALVASRFVLVDDVFISHAVDHACCFLQYGRCSSLVTGLDRGANALDSGTQH